MFILRTLYFSTQLGEIAQLNCDFSKYLWSAKTPASPPFSRRVFSDTDPPFCNTSGFGTYRIVVTDPPSNRIHSVKVCF